MCVLNFISLEALVLEKWRSMHRLNKVDADNNDANANETARSDFYVTPAC